MADTPTADPPTAHGDTQVAPAAGGVRMRTPSLRGRLMVVGIVIVALLVLALDAFVFFSLREALDDTLAGVLDARMQLVVELTEQLGPDELEARLTTLGVPAVIELEDGSRVESEPATRRFGELPPGEADVSPALASRSGALPGGGSVTVFASRGGIQQTLDQVLLVELIGSVIAVALSVAVLWRMSRVVLQPVDEIVGIARDIAAGEQGGRLEPERTDTELGRMATAFDEMLDALEAAIAESRHSEERMRRFLAEAAHQLRTPAAGIRASVETLLRTRERSERERLLDNLARESARMSRLVGSLLRIARLDQQQPPTRQPTDLGSLVCQETERAADLAPSLEIALDTEPPAEALSVPLEADSIREALANLLDNARRHAASRIAVTMTADDGGVRVSIRDDGPGLDPDRVDAAFEPFTSLDGDGGSGLGLPIARRIARAHGGDLSWDGTAFVLWLPHPAGPDGS